MHFINYFMCYEMLLTPSNDTASIIETVFSLSQNSHITFIHTEKQNNTVCKNCTPATGRLTAHLLQAGYHSFIYSPLLKCYYRQHNKYIWLVWVFPVNFTSNDLHRIFKCICNSTYKYELWKNIQFLMFCMSLTTSFK